MSSIDKDKNRSVHWLFRQQVSLCQDYGPRCWPPENCGCFRRTPQRVPSPTCSSAAHGRSDFFTAAETARPLLPTPYTALAAPRQRRGRESTANGGY